MGPYTAAAVASIAFNDPSAVVDGNVIRVVSRLRALPGDPTKLGAVHTAMAQDMLQTQRPGCFNQVGRGQLHPHTSGGMCRSAVQVRTMFPFKSTWLIEGCMDPLVCSATQDRNRMACLHGCIIRRTHALAW